jgi:hypothetical protein
MKTLSTNTKLVLAFFAGMLFLLLVNVGRGHNRHERFNREKFAQAGKVEMNDCNCEGKNFRFEGRQNFRHNGPEMKGMRNPEMRGMKGNPEMMRGRFSPAMRDSNMRDSVRDHNKLSFHHIERPINRIPIMLNEIEIVAPRLSYIPATNMICEVEVFAQKLS